MNMEKVKLTDKSLFNPVNRGTGLSAECPNCGEMIPIFGYTCGYCGYSVKVMFIAEEPEGDGETFRPEEIE
jgi:hypothetical protein